MKKIAALSNEERAEIFSETEAVKGITSAAAEKDFWLCWMLMIIFEHPELSKLLKLKGGTSLSKCYGLIDRFSEDIDLILDWKVLTSEDPNLERNKTQQDKFNKELNEKAIVYIRDKILPIIREAIRPFCEAEIDKEDGHTINVRYPKVFDDKYLRPEIKLEIGPLASMVPSDKFKVKPYAADSFPEQFEQPEAFVDAVKAERTFWEKVTILHVEAHRPADKALPARYSRHYYDVYKMLGTGAEANAMKDIRLLEDVVTFKKRFYPSSWANYDDAVLKTMKLMPPEARIIALKADYEFMEEMIFREYPDFDTVIESLSKFEKRLNGL